MEIPPPPELLAQIRALPAAAPLLERLPGQPPVHLVGGAVRDLLLNREPRELDLVVEGDPEPLAQRLGGIRRTHDRFHTSSVLLDGFRYDLARARSESYAQPGALPEVRPASLAEDLARRDFSINTLAVALGGDAPGELTSVPGALEDLNMGRLRVLHDRSFLDDPTRLLRLARYAARLGFGADQHTEELTRAAIATGALRTVSGARLGGELRLLTQEPDPVGALGQLADLGLDTAIDPDFGLRDAALAERALALMGEAGRPDRVALAVAAARVPPQRLATLLGKLSFSAGDRDVVVEAATRAEPVARSLSQATRPSEIAAAAAGASPELIAVAGALGPEAEAREWLARLRELQLKIDGSDLLAAGIPAGPAVGRGLRAARDAMLDGRVSDRAGELAEALRAARGRG